MSPNSKHKKYSENKIIFIKNLKYTTPLSYKMAVWSWPFLTMSTSIRKRTLDKDTRKYPNFKA